MKRNRMFAYASSVLLICLMVTGTGLPLKAGGVSNGMNDAKVVPLDEKRDPFWPIGYAPKNSTRSILPKSSAGTGVNSWDAAMKNVVINGVSSRKDNEYIAVINGDVKRVGDTVSVRLGNSIYTWAVDGIEPRGSVKLRRLSLQQD